MRLDAPPFHAPTAAGVLRHANERKIRIVESLDDHPVGADTSAAGASALERYARPPKSGDQLDAAVGLVDARVALEVARAELERALAEARSAYEASYRSARGAGWTTEDLRMHFGCRPPAFDEVRPAAWRPRPGAG